jgi:hypothetical protein
MFQCSLNNLLTMFTKRPMLAILLIYLPMHAGSLNVPFAVQASFPSFNLLPSGGGTASTGTWTITGTGTWAMDASTGIDTQTVDLTVTFPGLGISVPISFTATGPFVFAREIATNRVGILAENQGSTFVTLGSLVRISLTGINSIMPVALAQFPPFPTTPPSPLSLPSVPPGFAILPPSTLPQLSELGNVGTIMASGTVAVLGLSTQEFRGTGTLKIVPSNAKCPAGTANALTVLTGTWTFNMNGQAPIGKSFDAAGQFTASLGTIDNSQIGFLSLTESFSTPVSQETDSGSYQIFPNCSGGTLNLNVSNRPVAFDFWFEDSFAQIHFVSTTVNAAIRGSARRF